MAVKFDTVKAGDVLYDVRRAYAGRGIRGRVGCWTVVVESIDHVARKAMVRWNGNPATVAYPLDFKHYRRRPPKADR